MFHSIGSSIGKKGIGWSNVNYMQTLLQGFYRFFTTRNLQETQDWQLLQV